MRHQLALALLFASACRSTPPSVPPHAPQPALVQAPSEPVEYVPAAGLKWLISCSPARIFADPTLASALTRVVPSEGLDALALSTGVDARTLQAVAVAGFELGTLFVARLPSPDGGRARSRFEERLTSAIVKRPRPNIYRIAGTRAGSPRALVAVDDQLLAIAEDDLTLARIAEAYAERRLKSPTALHGAALAQLPQVGEDTLLDLFAPGPFGGRWAQALGGVARAALAVHVAVRHGEGGTLATEVTAVGDFEPGTEQRLAETWRDLAGSSTGRLFGLDQAKNLKVVADLHQLTWSLDLAIDPLVAGLRAATVANVSEILDVQPGAPAGSPAEPGSAP